MQGMHVFRPQARTVIDLESFVAKDHLLRKVDRVLDLSFVRDLTASCYGANGAREFHHDPAVHQVCRDSPAKVLRCVPAEVTQNEGKLITCGMFVECCPICSIGGIDVSCCQIRSTP